VIVSESLINKHKVTASEGEDALNGKTVVVFNHTLRPQMLQQCCNVATNFHPEKKKAHKHKPKRLHNTHKNPKETKVKKIEKIST